MGQRLFTPRSCKTYEAQQVYEPKTQFCRVLSLHVEARCWMAIIHVVAFLLVSKRAIPWDSQLSCLTKLCSSDVYGFIPRSSQPQNSNYWGAKSGECYGSCAWQKLSRSIWWVPQGPKMLIQLVLWSHLPLDSWCEFQLKLCLLCSLLGYFLLRLHKAQNNVVPVWWSFTSFIWNEHCGFTLTVHFDSLGLW